MRQDEIPRHWPWVIALGAVLAALGAIGLLVVLSWKPYSLLLVGWFLLASGLLQGLHTFSRHLRHWFPLDMIVSTTYVVAGLLILSNPPAGAVELTLLASGLLMVKGIVGIAMASGGVILNRLAVAAGGVVSLTLGIILWLAWPSVGLLILGSFLAIEIAVTGWTLIQRGLFEKGLVKRNALHAV